MSSAAKAILRPTASSVAKELRAALDIQRAAFISDGPPSLGERRADLKKLGSAIYKNADRIAQAVAADFGCRSRSETLLSEVYLSLSSIRHASCHLSRWMRSKRVFVRLGLLPGRAQIFYQPLGVVGIISPWNQPFYLSFQPLIAALAAGNRVMLKPSELTSRSAELVAELLASHFPAERVVTVLGGREIGAEFAKLPFDHLFYTGSGGVGKLVMEAAAQNLTPVTLELGGKSPCVIADDADLPSTVESIFHGKLFNAGQTCIAPDYVLIPTQMLDEFEELAEKTVARLYPTLKNNPDYASIINDGHYRRITGYLDQARTSNTVVLELNPAAEVLESRNRKIAPTLVINPANDLAVMQEEIFGPVLPVKTYEKLADAVEYINCRPRALALYYFGANSAKCNHVLQSTISGGGSVNTTMLHAAIEGLPFGGIGMSGMGAYHGEFGFQTFSHRRAFSSKAASTGPGYYARRSDH